jgi:hypothetical protein
VNASKKKRTTFETLKREARVMRKAIDMNGRIDALLADPKKNPMPIPDVAVPIVLSLAALIIGDGEESDTIRRCAEIRFDRWFIETAISQIGAATMRTTHGKKEHAK